MTIQLNRSQSRDKNYRVFPPSIIFCGDIYKYVSIVEKRGIFFFFFSEIERSPVKIDWKEKEEGKKALRSSQTTRNSRVFVQVFTENRKCGGTFELRRF